MPYAKPGTNIAYAVTRPAPLVPGTCVQGLNMGASTEGQEAGAAVTDSTPDSQPPPPPPPPPPLPYAPDFPSDQQSHEIPDHGPWYEDLLLKVDTISSLADIP
eukprot:134775-Rhodomonas_salina.2